VTSHPTIVSTLNNIFITRTELCFGVFALYNILRPLYVLFIRPSGIDPTPRHVPLPVPPERRLAPLTKDTPTSRLQSSVMRSSPKASSLGFTICLKVLIRPIGRRGLLRLHPNRQRSAATDRRHRQRQLAQDNNLHRALLRKQLLAQQRLQPTCFTTRLRASGRHPRSRRPRLLGDRCSAQVRSRRWGERQAKKAASLLLLVRLLRRQLRRLRRVWGRISVDIRRRLVCIYFIELAIMFEVVVCGLTDDDVIDSESSSVDFRQTGVGRVSGGCAGW
jgi:hypothetical protein